MAAQVLEDNPTNVDGWLSVQLDPNEEGSYSIVRIMEDHALDTLGTADIAHDEDFPPLYSAERQEFVTHAKSPAFTMSVTKVRYTCVKNVIIFLQHD